MTADTPDDNFREFAEAIRKILEEAIRDGDIPAAAFSITLAGPGSPEGIQGGQYRRIPQSVKEPDIEVFDSPDTRYITAELPGIDAGDIRFAVDGTGLHLLADGQETVFRKTIALDGVEPDTLRYTFRNGILEFSLRNITGSPERSAGKPR